MTWLGSPDAPASPVNSLTPCQWKSKWYCRKRTSRWKFLRFKLVYTETTVSSNGTVWQSRLRALASRTNDIGITFLFILGTGGNQAFSSDATFAHCHSSLYYPYPFILPCFSKLFRCASGIQSSSASLPTPHIFSKYILYLSLSLFALTETDLLQQHHFTCSIPGIDCFPPRMA